LGCTQPQPQPQKLNQTHPKSLKAHTTTIHITSLDRPDALCLQLVSVYIRERCEACELDHAPFFQSIRPIFLLRTLTNSTDALLQE